MSFVWEKRRQLTGTDDAIIGAAACLLLLLLLLLACCCCLLAAAAAAAAAAASQARGVFYVYSRRIPYRILVCIQCSSCWPFIAESVDIGVVATQAFLHNVY
jgi:hypothetical protein